MKKPAKKAAKRKYVIIGNERYGLYCGYLVSHDLKLRVAEVAECRHIARWHGKTGGITSLAAHGLCGPSAGDSRIGAPAPGVTSLSGVVNVFEASPEAQASFEKSVQT